MTTLREAAKLALESLQGYRRELDCSQPCDAERALETALAQQEQEPKAWMLTDDSGMRFVSVDRPHPDFVPLYTAPPRREWQSLTEEEIDHLWLLYPCSVKEMDAYARAIEAKLKEKNHE